MLISLVLGALMAVSGVAMGLGCWYAWRGLHPEREPRERSADG